MGGSSLPEENIFSMCRKKYSMLQANPLVSIQSFHLNEHLFVASLHTKKHQHFHVEIWDVMGFLPITQTWGICLQCRQGGDAYGRNGVTMV